MPRQKTTIPSFDERLSIDLRRLKEEGYFSGRSRGRLLSNQRYCPVRVVELHISFDEESIEESTRGWLRLGYDHFGGRIDQVIPLLRQASNLGRGGGIWYALCPITGRRCRRLYLGSRYFVSRWGIAGALYRSQQVSKEERAFRAVMRRLEELERLEELTRQWLFEPHSKRSYGGKLTRPMQRYLKLKAAAETNWQKP